MPLIDSHIQTCSPPNGSTLGGYRTWMMEVGHWRHYGRVFEAYNQALPAVLVSLIPYLPWDSEQSLCVYITTGRVNPSTVFFVPMMHLSFPNHELNQIFPLQSCFGQIFGYSNENSKNTLCCVTPCSALLCSALHLPSYLTWVLSIVPHWQGALGKPWKPWVCLQSWVMATVLRIWGSLGQIHSFFSRMIPLGPKVS